jgi:ADP-ribosylglycohydrolase
MERKFKPHAPDRHRQDLYRGCLQGGAVGDAIGAPVEFLRRSEILERFGAHGVVELHPAYGRLGAITDDTQMMLFTAEGLMRGFVRSQLKGICSLPSVVAHAYARWLYTQDASPTNTNGAHDGWLIGIAELHARRAPGNTCLSALRIGKNPAQNDSKGCGGVMRVAPVGMMLQAMSCQHPSSRNHNLHQAFSIACEVAAITHGHPTGQLASGAFSMLVFLLLDGISLTEATDLVLKHLSEHDHHEETTQAMQAAVRLAKEDLPPHEAIRELGQGWIAEEALAVGLYCALKASDYQSGVIMAVNHDGDSDSTGLIAGHLLGAIKGVGAIPASWLAPLELREVIEAVADDLGSVGEWQLDEPDNNEELKYYWNRYPGH